MVHEISPVLMTVALTSIASSSAFYTWVWYAPQQFKKMVAPSDPCAVMSWMAHLIKVVQCGSMLLATDWEAAKSISALSWLWFGAMVLLGQHLNYLVYERLGRDGVYYGFRFGKKIGWVTVYPYSVISDPQYWGCIATLLGCSVLFPSSLVMWWIANYAYLMWLESKVPADAAAAM